MTYIIADAGVNWRNLQEADQLIKECALAGVDAVKFQAYSTGETFGSVLFKELSKIQLNLTTIPYLYYRCLNYGVEFMATPMYPEAVDMLAPYVKTWKVRFKDRRNIDILQKIYAYSNKDSKVLISTDTVGANHNPNAYYLFCVPEYPPTSIPDLKCFEGFDGYSCHIPVVSHIAEVVRYQKSQYLEVHVMLEYENYEPIDQKVSLTIPDVKKLVATIRTPELYKKGRRIDITSHTDEGTRFIYLPDRTGGLLDDENYWI